jgi:hypothetical protein
MARIRLHGQKEGEMDEILKEKVIDLLDKHRIMTIPTLRPDGWPQATTVGYVSEGLTLYFLCGLGSQKARNLALDDRVSLTIDHDTPDLMAITGLSMAGHASSVTDRAESERFCACCPSNIRKAQFFRCRCPGPKMSEFFVSNRHLSQYSIIRRVV